MLFVTAEIYVLNIKLKLVSIFTLHVFLCDTWFHFETYPNY